MTATAGVATAGAATAGASSGAVQPLKLGGKACADQHAESAVHRVGMIELCSDTE